MIRSIGLGLLAMAHAAMAGELSSTASVDRVWEGNLFGSRTSPAAALIDGRFAAAYLARQDLRLTANGRWVHIGDDPDLDNTHLGLALDGAWPGSGGVGRLAAGLAGSLRANRDVYTVYDYRELAAFGSYSRRLRPATLFELRLDGAQRSYPDWSVEDARMAWVQARISRSLPSRTSLGLTGRVGWKHYTSDPADATLWELSLRAAQSLSPLLGVRGWVTYAHAPAHPDVSAQLTAFENPLLDAFSAEGTRCGLAVKAKRGDAWWLEAQAEYLDLTFPGRPPGLYDVEAEAYEVDATGALVLLPGERQDTAVVLRFGGGRRILRGRSLLQAGVEWTTQDSNDLNWVWQDWSGYVGVAFTVGST